MKHLFIINPAAGKYDHTKEYAQTVERVLRKYELEYEIALSTEPGDCEVIARRAAETYKVCERLHNKCNRQNYAERRQSVHARSLYFCDIHSVDNIIKERNQLRDYGGDCQSENQRQDFTLAKLLRQVLFCLFHALISVSF